VRLALSAVGVVYTGAFGRIGETGGRRRSRGRRRLVSEDDVHDWVRGCARVHLSAAARHACLAGATGPAFVASHDGPQRGN